MKVEEIVPDHENNVIKLIEGLKRRTTKAPDLAAISKSLNLEEHDVYNKALRKDKTVYKKPKLDANGKITDKGPASKEPVNRIGLALQKLLIKRIASFIFGNPVIRNHTAKTEIEKRLATSLEDVLDDIKEVMLNRQVARTVLGYQETAEYIYTVESKVDHETYGFKTGRKIRSVLFSPVDNQLYPYFDATGDLIAFSREFTVDKISFFETYTDTEIRRWKRSGTSQWEELPVELVTIGKIPVVYAYQSYQETSDVDDIIARLEKLLSNLGDTNDYHSAPKIFVNGKIASFGSKEEANTVIQGEKDTTAQYLSWDHAPESFKVEVENLAKFMFMIMQVPDISFDSLKGIPSISGVALKLLFTDAHLKVKDKEEIFIPYLQRRYSIIKSYLVEMDNTLKPAVSLVIKPQIEPYMVADDLTFANMLSVATGGKAFMSQKEAVKQFGGSESDYDVIQKEAATENAASVFETTL